MTPEHLQHALTSLVPGVRLDTDPPDAVLRAVERAAEDRPSDRTLSALAREVARFASANRGLQTIVGGVRRERLIRWDPDTTTWIGTDIETGAPAQVRVIRPEVDEPVLRRFLAREARALRPVLPTVRADGPAMVEAAPGQPLDMLECDVRRVTRALGTAVAGLARYEAEGLGLPTLVDEEVRWEGDCIHLVCLSPDATPDPGSNLATFSHRLIAPESAIAEVVEGFRALPPRSSAEAGEHLIAAMARHLTSEWHAHRIRHHRTAHADRIARLHATLGRLSAVMPPPRGRGAVGVDLEGRVTVVTGSEGKLAWGTVDRPELVWSPDGLNAPLARRLLRARAAAPPNPRLEAMVGGNPAYVEAVGRWLAASLRLRTLFLLLEKALAV